MSKTNPKLLRKFNQELNTVVLVWLLNQSDELLAQWNLDQQVLRRLRDIPIRDIKISTNSVVRIDATFLRQTLKISEVFRRERLLIDRAIQCDARYNLLRTYTGISRADYHERAQSLGIPAPSGRIRVLNIKESQRISKTWHSMDFRKKEPLRALCVLSEQTSLPLSSIWASFGAKTFS